MNDTANGFLSTLPFGDKLGPIIIALIILVVGLLLARLIRGVVEKALSHVSFLNRTAADGSTTNFARPIAMLVYYLIVLFVLIAVLAQMGLTDVLDPLKAMASQFVNYIPNIIGAGIVGYVGYILAKIISDFVGIGLGKADEQLALKTGNSDIQVSKLGKTFVFAAILLPIIVAALGILDIEAISGPATAMIQKLMAAIPNIIAAGVILTVTWFVAKFVVQILTGILDGMQVDTLPQKLGITGLFTPTFTPTRLVGGAVMFFAMLTGFTAAVDKLNISIISEIMARVLEFGGGILIGGVILVIGNFLSMLAHDAIAKSNPWMAGIARFAILGLVLAMGLKAMGLADNIVNMAFGFTLGAVAVAASLAFGFGGRDAAKRIADNIADKIL
jgi:hypothetical protein